MKRLSECLNCGSYYLGSNSEVGNYIVSKLSDITEKIIPFFFWKASYFSPARTYKGCARLLSAERGAGVKCLDFKDFCIASDLIKNKAHFTELGLNQIKKVENINLNKDKEKGNLLWSGKLSYEWGLGGLDKFHSNELEDLSNNPLKVSKLKSHIFHGFLIDSKPLVNWLQVKYKNNKLIKIKIIF